MEKNVRRDLRSLDLMIKGVLFLLIIVILQLFYCSYNINEIRTVQMQEENINEGYAEEDIEVIEEVRNFFLCYYDAQEYDASFSSWGPVDYIVDDARELLRKYETIRLDEDKNLTYSKEKRNIQIIQDTFILDTEYNVDMLSSYDEYIYSEIGTPCGTWAKIDSGVPEYILFLFGTEMKTIQLDDVSLQLSMVDINKKNPSVSYGVDTEYYLFNDYNSSSITLTTDYYIYVVKENRWIPCNSIIEVEITDDYISFVSFEDKTYEYYVYCIEHNSKIGVKEIEYDDGLIYIYRPIKVYIPESLRYDDDFINGILENHEECSQ